MTQFRLQAGLGLLLLVLAMPGLAPAGEPPATEGAPASDLVTSPRVTVVEGSLDQAPAFEAGMLVAIDPATGRLRQPTEAEAADLSVAGRFHTRHPEGADLEQFAVKSGGVGLLLDSRYLISETVQLRLDGSLEPSHVSGLPDWLSVHQPALPAQDSTAAETEQTEQVQP